MRVIDLEQGSAEWLAFRKDKIGGSDAPIIMGDSPYCTPYQLWLDKLGLEKKKVNQWATSHGTRKEPAVREMLNKLYGPNLVPLVGQDDDDISLIASFDAADISRRMFREIKCLGKEEHELALNGKVPTKYKAQLQHQMMVTNQGVTYYDSYNAEFLDKSLWSICVEVDDQYQEDLYNKEKEFLHCLRTLTPPPLMERDYVEKDTDEWISLCREYRQAEQSHKEWETIKDSLRRQLISLAGGSNTKGGGMRLSKIVRRGNVEYGIIPELKGIDLEKYRKPSVVSWRIDVKE